MVAAAATCGVVEIAAIITVIIAVVDALVFWLSKAATALFDRSARGLENPRYDRKSGPSASHSG